MQKSIGGRGQSRIGEARPPGARVPGWQVLIDALRYATRAERRVLLRVLLELRSDTRASQLISLAIDELAQFAGLAGESIKAGLMAVTDRLSRRIVSIADATSGEVVQAGLLSARYPASGANVEIEVAQVLLAHMLELKTRFSVGELEGRMGLGGGHAKRLYELLRTRLQGSGQGECRGRVEVGIEELQTVLGVRGRYAGRFNNFRSRVVSRVCAEISRDTDIEVTYWMAGASEDSRRPGSFVFEVKERRRTGHADTELTGRLVGAGLSRADAEQMIAAYATTDRDRIVWHLDELERKLKRSEIRSSPAGWLKVAVRNDYRPRQSDLERRISKNRQDKEAAVAAKRAGDAQAQRQEETREQKIRAAISAIVDRLTTTEREAWADEVSRQLKSDLFRKSWTRRHDFTALMFRNEVAAVIERHTGADVRQG